MKIRRTLAAVAVTVVAAGMSLVGVVSAGASPSHTAVVAATAPGPPSGYVKTYTRNFAHTVGLGDWKIQPGNGATVHDSTKPGAEFGVGVEMTGVNQWAELISNNAVIGPNTYVQALVYFPSASGKDGMGRSYPAGSTANWPAWWTAGNPWPENGEIDALEGIRGQSQFHGFYGPSVAGKISSPNFNATPNSIGTGWFELTFLRQNGQITAWYGSHKVGTFALPTSANETLRFQNQSYSTSVCGNCFGPTLLGVKSTAWLSNVTVWSKPSTTPTPTPTQTTPTPTPTPTTPSPTATSAACVTSADFGSCGPYAFSSVSANNADGNAIQDVWNHVDINQTLTAHSASDWSVSATSTGTAVQSYPDTQQTMTTSSDLANSLTPDVNSTYAETVPSNGIWESAYDIWLGSLTNSGSQYNQEIMVWTDNHGQTPAGSNTGKTAVIGGVTYDIWTEPGNSTVTLEATTNSTSGGVDVTTAIQDLQADGYVAAGEGYSQVDYGYEICSTNGSPETFALTGYTLSS